MDDRAKIDVGTTSHVCSKHGHIFVQLPECLRERQKIPTMKDCCLRRIPWGCYKSCRCRLKSRLTEPRPPKAISQDACTCTPTREGKRSKQQGKKSNSSYQQRRERIFGAFSSRKTSQPLLTPRTKMKVVASVPNETGEVGGNKEPSTGAARSSSVQQKY